MKQRKLGTSHLEAGLISWCVSQLRDEPGKLSFSYHMLKKTRKKKNQDLFPFHFLSPPTICSCAQLWLLLRKTECGARQEQDSPDRWQLKVSSGCVFPVLAEVGTPNSVEELLCFHNKPLVHSELTRPELVSSQTSGSPEVPVQKWQSAVRVDLTRRRSNELLNVGS